MKNYEGYSWIKVKRHQVDPWKTWEDRYRDLEKHHIEETSFLIDEVRLLAKKLLWIYKLNLALIILLCVTLVTLFFIYNY